MPIKMTTSQTLYNRTDDNFKINNARGNSPIPFSFSKNI